MGTINKQIADDVIAGKYEEDHPIKIVKYDDAWGGVGYGLICQGQDPNRYAESEFVRNPVVYWERTK